MRIARALNNLPTQCDGDTDPSGQYKCCVCGEIVYPRNDLKKEQGRKREYYFAHYTDTCGGSIESYFHWIAKQIIANTNEITLPDGIYNYQEVVLECTSLHASIRPDVFLNKEVIIEVCYKNPKREREVSIFKELNITTVEIDLSVLDFDSSLDQVEDLVLRETTNKTYLHQRFNQVPASETNDSLHPVIFVVGVVLTFLGIKKIFTLLFGNSRVKGSHLKERKKRNR